MVRRVRMAAVGGTMKWPVMAEVTGEDGAVTRHVISEGERTEVGQAATLGLSLAEGKATLSGRLCCKLFL